MRCSSSGLRFGAALTPVASGSCGGGGCLLLHGVAGDHDEADLAGTYDAELLAGESLEVGGVLVAGELALEVRVVPLQGRKLLLGGLHVLSCFEECAPHADALALGDGVQLWPRILRDMDEGRLQARYYADVQFAGPPRASPSLKRRGRFPSSL